MGEEIVTVPIEQAVRATAAHFLRRAEMPDATRTYLQAMSIWRYEPAFLNKVVAQGDRVRVAHFLIFYHLLADSNRHDGATFAKISAACARRGGSGDRAIRTVIGIMQMSRLVSRERSSEDRRLVFYRPRPAFIAMVRDLMGRSLTAFDALFPGTNWADRLRDDPAFFRLFYVECGKFYVEDGLMVTEMFPALDRLFMMNGGVVTLALIARAAFDGGAYPSTSDIARVGPSRTQAWLVVKAAAADGLVTLSDTGRIEDAQMLLDLLTNYIATELAFYAVGMAELGAFDRKHLPQ